MAVPTSPKTIRMPHGAEASFAEMKSYGNVLQTFITEQEANLDDIEDARNHDAIVEYLQSLANSYNEQLHIYKAKEAHQQRKVMYELMRVLEN